MSPEHRPVVSIGMPVYNGAAFIRQAIESVLNQDFADLELIISDNASTDATEHLCRTFAESPARDPRVRYIRQPNNIGVFRNYGYVLDVARGEFFSWLACDDYYEHETHIGRLLEKLQQGHTMAYPNVNLVEYDGNASVRSIKRDHFGSFRGLKQPAEIRRETVRFPSQQFYGLYRVDVARRYLPIWAEDAVMVCFNEGRFVHRVMSEEQCVFVPDAYLNVGIHQGSTSGTTEPQRLWRDFMRYTSRLLVDYRRSSLSGTEKLILYTHIARVHFPYGVRLFGLMLKNRIVPSSGQRQR